jgi:hypothetical protein
MEYIVYRTTCLNTGQFYIGVHGQTSEDSYLGSGLRLKRLVTKHGKENFIRETLASYLTEAEAFDKEVELLGTYLTHPLNVNISKGGALFAGRTHSDETKKILAEKSSNRKLSVESKAKISEANRRRISKYGLPEGFKRVVGESRHSEEVKKKISAALVGRSRKPFSEESKKKMSNAAKLRYSETKLTRPHGSASCYMENKCRKFECSNAYRLYKKKIVLYREVIPV